MRLVTVFVLVFGLMAASCAVYTRPAPPPPRAEIRGGAPCAHAVWVKGHWKWEGRRVGYRWIPGHWRCP